MTAARVRSPSPFSDHQSRRKATAVGLIGLLSIILCVAWWRQRVEPATLLPAIASYAVLVYLSGWWRSRLAWVITAVLDIALIFIYLWALDDRVHIVIRGTATAYSAQIGDTTLVLRAHVRPGRVGLYSGPLNSYRTGPTGEAVTDRLNSPLARLGAYIRVAAPLPAWNDIHAEIAGRRDPLVLAASNQIQTMTGRWSMNARGEVEGQPGSNAFIGSLPSGNFVVSADLMRGDGTQGIVLGVDDRNHGFMFAPRLDQPDAIWLAWSNGVPTHPLVGTSIHVSLLPQIQRDVRLLLGNAIVALLLLGVSPLLYLLFLLILRWFGETPNDTSNEPDLAERYPRLLDLLAAAAAVGAIVGTGLIATQLLESIPHVQDDVAYLFQAKSLALGHLWVPTPRLPAFFTEEFIPMYHGRWFSKYPPGWPFLLSAGVILHLPWLVNPVLTGADIWLMYLIGREVYGRSVGLIAAGLALSSPLLLFLGGSYMSHTSALFYLSGFAYLTIRWLHRARAPIPAGARDWQLLAPAGFLLGMAGITRGLDAAAFAAPFAVFTLYQRPTRLLRSYLWLLSGAAVPMIGLLLYNWDLTGSALTSPYSLWWSFDHLGFGPQVGFGHTVAKGFWNLGYNLEMLMAHLFGWPFYFTLAFGFVPFLTGRSNRWDVLFGASALSVMGAYVLYWHPGVMYGPRYYYVAVPWLALLTARGLEELYRWPLRLALPFPRDRLGALLMPVSLVAIMLAYSIGVYLRTQIPIYRGYNYTSAAKIDAVHDAHLHHAVVFVDPGLPGQWWEYGAVFSSNSPLLNSDIVYARDLGPQDRALMRLYPGRRFYVLKGTVLRPYRVH